MREISNSIDKVNGLFIPIFNFKRSSNDDWQGRKRFCVQNAQQPWWEIFSTFQSMGCIFTCTNPVGPGNHSQGMGF